MEEQDDIETPAEGDIDPKDENGDATTTTTTSTRIKDAGEPHAANGEKITLQHAHGPANLWCCHKFHPTHGTVVINGKEYKWKARNHRKLRYPEGKQEQHPSKGRFRLWCWEPHIVTWYICWIGVIANTLWVVNGAYAVWPEQASNANPEYITMITGIVGAFLFIITGYLGYVEAINQSHHDVEVPTLESKKEKRKFHCPPVHYGKWPHPLGTDPIKRGQIHILGFPMVQDAETHQLLTPRATERYLEMHGDDSDLQGRHLDIVMGKHVLQVTIDSVSDAYSKHSHHAEQIQSLQQQKDGYRWWTWYPDLHYIGILNALVFFIATIIFFIPAVVWYPMEQHESPLGSVIFWNYTLQIVASIGFCYVGHAAMAEASGSWIKPDVTNLGWWISLFNTVGGYGFLLYPVLFLPEVVDPEGNHDSLSKWGAAMATFWGSCCFWIAGILQCIEFSSQHPIVLSSLKKAKE